MLPCVSPDFSGRFGLHQFIQGNKPDSAVLNVDRLRPMTAALIWGADIDAFDHFVQNITVKYLNSHIILCDPDKLINR